MNAKKMDNTAPLSAVELSLRRQLRHVEPCARHLTAGLIQCEETAARLGQLATYASLEAGALGDGSAEQRVTAGQLRQMAILAIMQTRDLRRLIHGISRSLTSVALELEGLVECPPHAERLSARVDGVIRSIGESQALLDTRAQNAEACLEELTRSIRRLVRLPG